MLIRKIAYGYTRVAAWSALRRSMRQRRKFVSAARMTATRWLAIFTRCTMSGCAVGGADFLTNRSAIPVRTFWRNATAVLLFSTSSSIVELRRSRRRNKAFAWMENVADVLDFDFHTRFVRAPLIVARSAASLVDVVVEEAQRRATVDALDRPLRPIALVVFG